MFLFMGRHGPTYTKACTLQRKLYETMLDPKTAPRLLAQLSTAWERLEERKRIMRMKPRPRDIDVSRVQRSKESDLPVHFREPT